MIALSTVLCGGQTPVDMHIFGRAKEEFLRVSFGRIVTNRRFNVAPFVFDNVSLTLAI